MTGFIFEATHLVIDPASLFGPAALRACTPDQRVVTNEWLKESILTQDWAPEDLYEYQQPVELPAVASPVPGPPKEEPQDGSSRYAPPSPPCLSDTTAHAHFDFLALFSGVGVSKWKRWLPEEDDLLVRFLVPVVGKPNVKGTDGQDAFDRYAASGVSPLSDLRTRRSSRIPFTPYFFFSPGDDPNGTGAPDAILRAPQVVRGNDQQGPGRPRARRGRTIDAVDDERGAGMQDQEEGREEASG